MRCKDIERLIIDSSEEDLSSEELSVIEQHIAHCTHCERFRNDLGRIRMYIQTMPQPVTPPDLAQETRLRCYAEMSSRQKAAETTQIAPSDPIPKYVWAALLSLILLTVIVIVPSLIQIRWDQSLTFASLAILTLVIQNAAMLFFAPILIRKYRQRGQNFRGIPMNAKAL